MCRLHGRLIRLPIRVWRDFLFRLRREAVFRHEECAAAGLEHLEAGIKNSAPLPAGKLPSGPAPPAGLKIFIRVDDSGSHGLSFSCIGVGSSSAKANNTPCSSMTGLVFPRLREKAVACCSARTASGGPSPPRLSET